MQEQTSLSTHFLCWSSPQPLPAQGQPSLLQQLCPITSPQVTDSSWFARGFPGFNAEDPMSREDPRSQANWDSWPPNSAHPTAASQCLGASPCLGHPLFLGVPRMRQVLPGSRAPPMLTLCPEPSSFWFITAGPAQGP